MIFTLTNHVYLRCGRSEMNSQNTDLIFLFHAVSIKFVVAIKVNVKPYTILKFKPNKMLVWKNITSTVVRYWVFTIYTNHPHGNFVQEHKTTNFDLVGEKPTKKYIQINRLKRVEIFHHLKSQPIFSEASQIEWRKTFDFPTRIFYFLM